MSDEMRLLKAFIEAVGYEVEPVWRHPTTMNECNSPLDPSQRFVPFQDFKVAKREKQTKRQPNLRSARKPVGSGYPDWFEGIWADYPKRKDGLVKAKTYACCNRRIKDGYTEAYLHERTRAYAAHCDSEDKTGTNFVLMGSTFFGSDLRFEDLWTIAEKKKADGPEFKIPRSNEELWNWAKQHKYPGPGSMTYQGYRQLLANEVEKRLAAS